MARQRTPTAESAKKRSFHVNEFEWDSERIARGVMGLLIVLAAALSVFSAAPAHGA